MTDRAEASAHSTERNYATHDVAVRGGSLRVATWEPLGHAADGPTVLAVHGLTASHLEFAWLADALPGRRIVAPDLRGRGRSSELPGPYGLVNHADDLAAVADALGIGPALVVGHSMGGFVAVVAADRHPQLVDSLVLVDGGLPLPVPPWMSAGLALQLVIGPIVGWMARTFPDREAYLRQFEQHPAFAGHWDERARTYAAYDIAGTEPRLRACANPDAVREDSRDLLAGDDLRVALRRLRHPTRFVYAPIGMGFDAPPTYAEQALQAWRADRPDVPVELVPGVNHFSIMMSDAGAAAVARLIG